MKYIKTFEQYAELILAMYLVGLEDPYATYQGIYGADHLGNPERFIRTCAIADFESGQARVYQHLIDQADTNEWGAGVTLTKAQVIQLLAKGPLPVGFDIMCKEYGDDDDWVGLDSDDYELMVEDDENYYKTFVLESLATACFWPDGLVPES